MIHSQDPKSELLLHYILQGMSFVHCSEVFPLLEKTVFISLLGWSNFYQTMYTYFNYR